LDSNEKDKKVMNDKQEDMERRDFLKTGLGVAAGTAALGSGLAKTIPAEAAEKATATSAGSNNMPRIPYKKIDDVEDKEVAESWRNRSMDSAMSHMMGHAEGFMAPLSELNAIVTGYSGPFKMTRLDRELVSVRTGLLCNSHYMASIHSLAALGHGGVSDEQVAALHAGEMNSDVFDDSQKLLLKFTTEVVKNVKASDATMEAMRKVFTDRQIMEYIILIGTRMIYCQIAENGGISPEDNAIYDDVWKGAHFEYPYRGLNGDPLGGGHPDE
jgi:4-carboxymuconolactone decarboxylase